MRKYFATLLIIILLCFTSCSSIDDSLKESADTIVEAFTNGDSTAIEEMVFGIEQQQIDDEASSYFKEDEDQNGIMSLIIKKTEVSVKKIDTKNSVIIYTVKSPDMSTIFTDLPENINSMSESDIKKHILDRVQNGEKTNTEIKIAYVEEDGNYTINYQTPEFIDAITGGLLTAYKTAYQEMTNQILEGMEAFE